MNTIKDLDFFFAKNNDTYTITVQTNNVPKNVILKNVVIPLRINSVTANAEFNVEFWLNGNKKWITDRLSGLSNQKDIKICITDEFQKALDENCSQLQFLIVNENGNSQGIDFQKIPADNKSGYDIEYISNAQYQENGSNHSVDLGKAGDANISLNTGILTISHIDTQSDSNVLPLSIKHIYNSSGTLLPEKDCIKNYCGKGWKLNVEQYLIEKTDDNNQLTGEYEYIDENGKSQLIVEKFYYKDYVDGICTKHYVERNNPNVMINLDGKLQFNKGDTSNPILVDLESEWDAPSGLKLVTSKEDIKGANLVDNEPDELLQLKEQVKQYTYSKKSLDSNIKSNKEQLCYMALAKKALVDQISIQLDSISLSKSQIDYQIDNRKLLCAYAKQSINSVQNVDLGRDFLESVENDFTDQEVQNIINRALEGVGEPAKVGEGDKEKTLTEPDMEFVLRYFNDKNNLDATWASSFNVKQNWDKNSISNDSVENCDMKTQLTMVNKNKNFYNTVINQDNVQEFLNNYLGSEVINNLSLTETVSNLFNENVSNNSYTLTLGAKDLLSLDIQIQSLIENIMLSQEQLEDCLNNIIKLNNQLYSYKRQIPQFYLYNDSVIYGFSPIITETEVADTTKNEITYEEISHIYRLNYIADTYENTIVINYEKNTNKIENIIVSKDGVISFEYDKDLLTSVVDAQEHKISFVYNAISKYLEEITYFDGTKSKYLYDGNGHIIAVIDPNGIGAKFSYQNQSYKVVQINEISILSQMENGTVSLNDDLFNNSDYVNIPTSPQYITLNYKNYLSTTISSMKLVNGESTTEKSLTYIFDNEGRVRTIYENVFDENNPNNSNPVVKSFDYVADNKQINVEPLLNSKNYMKDKCFEGQAVDYDTVNFLGNGLTEGDTIYCGDDIYCEQYLVHKEYHAFSDNEQVFCKSLSMSSENIDEIKSLQTDNLGNTWFVLGGWAKADSAFVFNPDNDEDINSYPEYILNRKFELRVMVTYSDLEQTEVYSKCFDWMNTDWQYCALPVPIKNNKTLTSIDCFFDYSNNTNVFETQSDGTKLPKVYFTDFTFNEASFEEKIFSNKVLQEVISSHSIWKQLYSYDENDRLISVKYIDTTQGSAGNYINRYYYNKNGKLIKTIDYRGLVTEKVYNDYGEEIKSLTYHKDNPSEIFYSEQKLGEKGEVLADYNELGEEVNSYEYVKGTGIVSSVVDFKGNKTAYGYDTVDGTLLQMSSDVNGVSNTNTYGYTLGFLTKVSHNDFDINYDYDQWGRVSKIKVAESEYLTFIYDDSKNSTVSTYSNTESFKTVSDKDGNVIEVYYRPKVTTSEPTPSYTLLLENIYDTHGNLIATNDKITNTTHQYTLDKFGNTTLQEDTQHGVSISKENTYDKYNNNTNVKYTLNTNVQNYVYNYDTTKPQSELQSITLPNNAIQTIEKDKLDRTHEISLVNNENKATKLYYYLKNGDHASNLVSSIWYGNDKSLKDFIKYKYDENGNITEIYENSNLQTRYKYDSLSRLVREDNFAFRKTTTWEYDAGGNILNRKEYPYTLSEDLSKYVDINLLSEAERESNAYSTYNTIPYYYANNGMKDRLVNYNGNEIIYDAIGNPTKYGNNELVWEKGRQLKSFGNIANYTYNANGIRIGKSVENIDTQYFLDGTRIMAQKDKITIVTQDESGTATETIVETMMHFMYGVDGIVGFTLTANDTTKNYFYKKNGQGDIIGILDNNLQLIAKYDYDAWGNQKISYLDNEIFVDFNDENDYTNNNNNNLYIVLKNPFRYRSYYFDQETGLYYLNSRYYDPQIGRFINVDDISIIDEGKGILNGLNLFIYCNDNPVMLIDACGEAWWHWLIGAIIVAATAVAVVVTAGGALAGVAAVTSVLAGGSAATLGATIAAGAFIGSVTTFAAMGLIGGISGAVTWNNTGSFTAGFNEFASYGETAMWSTLGAGIIGGVLGGVSYVANRFNSNKMFSKREIKQAVRDTLNDPNKMNHIMQPKHLLPNSTQVVGKIMQKTLLRGTVYPYKTVLSANWKNYQVIFTIVNNKLRISDMWRIFINN